MPAIDSSDFGWFLSDPKAKFSWVTGKIRASNTTETMPPVIHGRRMTVKAYLCHMPVSPVCRKRMGTTRKRSILVPTTLSTAGSSVMETASAVIGTSNPPKPIDSMKVTPVRISEEMPMATVSPEKKMARPVVSMVRTMDASTLPAEARSSSRNR